MNPPHILIARNSRGQNNLNSASLSSPTETHAAAAGIFRSAGSPTWYFEDYESDGIASSLSTNGDMEDPIEIDETFTRSYKFPGNVKIVVESTTFWWVSPPIRCSCLVTESVLVWTGRTRRCSISPLPSSRLH